MGWWDNMVKSWDQGIGGKIRNPGSVFSSDPKAQQNFNTVMGAINPIQGARSAFDRAGAAFGRGDVGSGMSNALAGVFAPVVGGSEEASDFVSNPMGYGLARAASNNPNNALVQNLAYAHNLDEVAGSQRPSWTESGLPQVEDNPAQTEQDIKNQKDLLEKQQRNQQSLNRAMKRANAASAARQYASQRGGMASMGASTPGMARAFSDIAGTVQTGAEQSDADLQNALSRMWSDYDLWADQRRRAQADLVRQQKALADQAYSQNVQGGLQTAASIGSFFI